MRTTYRCENCNKEFTVDIPKPIFSVPCECGNMAIKAFKYMTVDKEDDDVSEAIEMMKMSSLPSGNTKTVI